MIKKIRRTKKKSKEIDNIIKRIPSGIDVIDASIEGGLEENSVTLVSGSAGSGKSILSAQFIYNGIVNSQDIGLYICFEEKKESFYRHMQRFGWDFAKYEKDKKFIFLEYTPQQVKKMIEEGGGTVEGIIGKFRVKRLVIDSITAFTILYKDDLSKKEAALSLFKMLRDWNVTSLVTGESEEEDIEKQRTGDIQFEVDGVILLYFIKEQNVRKRALEILKMRGTKHSKRIFSMDITSKGIEINPTGAVF